jgi:serine protease Do
MITRRRLAASALALPFAQAFAGVAQAADQAADQPIVAAIRLNDKRVLIDVLLDDKGPFSFVIDTGAVVSGVRDPVAQQLGLKKLRDVRLNENKSFPLYAVDQLVLGGALRQQGAALAGLSETEQMLGGDGLLAAGMVTSLDSELDFDKGQWRIYPAGTPDRTDFTALASELRDAPGANGSARIFADVKVGDAIVRPVLDTGMPWVLTLTHAVGKRLGLWNDTTPYAPVRLRGIAGPGKSPARLVRAPSLRIGPADYAAPLIVVRPPDAFGDDHVLGLPVLRTLNLSIDHAARTVWVKRNSLSSTDSHYGGSGIWVDADGDKVKVAEVGIGSPAAKAGVQPGDVLDGVGALRDAIALLGGPIGSPVALKLRRARDKVGVDFTLAAYL